MSTNNNFNIYFVRELPSVLLPNSFYFIYHPSKPKFYVTTKNSEPKLINPDNKLSLVINSINGMLPESNGNLNFPISFENGVLTIQNENFNLDERYITNDKFNKAIDDLNRRLSDLVFNSGGSSSSDSSTTTSGLKIPEDIDIRLYRELPSKPAGTVLRCTTFNTIDKVDYNLGDLLVYYNSSSPPVHITKSHIGQFVGLFDTFEDLPNRDHYPTSINSLALTRNGDLYYQDRGFGWSRMYLRQDGVFMGIVKTLPTSTNHNNTAVWHGKLYYYDKFKRAWKVLITINDSNENTEEVPKANRDASNIEDDDLVKWKEKILEDLVTVTGDDF